MKKKKSIIYLGCNGTCIRTENVRFGTHVPNKYSIVVTTAQVEFHWKLPVLYIATFDKKQSLIF